MYCNYFKKKKNQWTISHEKSDQELNIVSKGFFVIGFFFFSFNYCRGRFATMAENARTAESPLGFFRGVYCGESSPKFKMYNEQKTDGVLTRENQNYNNKSVEKA